MMSNQRLAVLNQVEEMISHLSRKEQLWLVEKIVRCLQESPIKGDAPEQTIFKNQLVAMAADPEIQAELYKIEQGFGITERDGLELE